MSPYIMNVYNSMEVLYILSLLSFSFFFQHMITLLFAKKLGRIIEIPTLMHFVDFILITSDIYYMNWYSSEMRRNLDTAANEE